MRLTCDTSCRSVHIATSMQSAFTSRVWSDMAHHFKFDNTIPHNVLNLEDNQSLFFNTTQRYRESRWGSWKGGTQRNRRK